MPSIYKPTRVENGKRIKCQFWRIGYTDENGHRRSIKGYADKSATEQMAHDIQTRIERIKAGLPVAQKQTEINLPPKLEAYDEDMRRQGLTKTHIATQIRTLKRLATMNGWKTTRDLTTPSLSKALAEIANAGRASLTQQHYRKAALAFAAWLVRMEHIPANPFKSVRPPKMTNRPCKRRAPTIEEFQRLVSGPRGEIYLLAGVTGLRYNELRQAQRQDFDLNSNKIALRPEISKTRRTETIPMINPAIGPIRAIFADTEDPEAQLVSQMPAAKTIKRDIAAARILPDAQGRRVDFHALRYFYCTVLGRAMPIQQVRIMMRHSDIRTTCQVYLDLGLEDLNTQQIDLPNFVLPLAHTQQFTNTINHAPEPVCISTTNCPTDNLREPVKIEDTDGQKWTQESLSFSIDTDEKEMIES
jgi:integrase